MTTWRRLFHRPDRDAELAREIRFYVDTATDENLACGMSSEEARAAAIRKFGNASLIREEIYLMNRISLIEKAWLDLRYGARITFKNPAFAATAVLILALGIGGNAAMFSVIRAVLLKPLPYRDPGRLVQVSVDNPRLTMPGGSFTALRYQEMRRAAKSFAALGVYSRFTEDMALSGRGEPEMFKGARVSANFLDVLGVRPALGRAFLPEEDTPGGPPVAMISSALWKRRFGADPHVAGRTAILNAVPYTIIGVLPAAFEFPIAELDVWVTRPTETSALPARFWPFVSSLKGFARLRPQTSLERARAEAEVLNRQYLAANPESLDGRAGMVLRLIPMQEQLVADVRPILWMLFGAVGCVLLIACANVASLLLTRSAWRARELAVRAAMGASRGRLIAQSLAESLVLAGAGGVLGVLLAKWALTAFAGMPAFNLPRAGEIQLDATVLAFSVAVSCVTGVLAGLLPSLQASDSNIADLLRESGAAAGRVWASRSWRFHFSSRRLLVAGQIGLSIVLLIGAALLIESMAALRSVNPGLQPANLLTARIALSPTRYDTPQKSAAFFDEVLRRTRALPGVSGAAWALAIPQSVLLRTNVQVGEAPEGDVTKWPMAQLQSVTTGYFHTLGIRIRQGREFDDRDNRPGAQPVVLVNETFARQLAPGANLLGQVMREGMDRSGWMQIIGIVGDVREGGLAADAQPEFYVLPRTHSSRSAYLMARTQVDPMQLVSAIRSQVLAVDRDQPLSNIATMDQVIESGMGRRRLTMLLLGFFAAIALLLATVGIYGTIAYSGAQRTQEMGIRRALGAQDGDILRLLLGQGLMLALAGTAIGIMGALVLTRVMKGLLFHISPADPSTYAGIALLWIMVAAAASYVPARRATRVDPAHALRVG
ncbi:MAG TPA: ABC transporter permease [Bryobacteraceae bacterium]|nr:ABC transporter permease [Bryobacteraceae bacterium]